MLLWRRQRFVCDNCGERHIENHDRFEGINNPGVLRRVAHGFTNYSNYAARGVLAS